MHTAARSALLAALMTATGVAFGATGGCSGKKNTEIMVGVQTDVRIPKDIDEVQLQVFVDGVVVFDPRSAVGDGQASLPGSFGIVAGSDRGTPIVVEVIGYGKDIRRVIRRARLTFVQGKTIFLRMPLKFACYEATECPADQTCIGGECKSADVDSALLPEYTSATQIFGNGAGSGSDTCFSAEECFGATSAPTGTGDGCTFLAQGATDGGGFTGAPFTPAIKLPNASTSLGYCVPGGACFVPIDHDADEGWEWTDAASQQTFTLAPGLCAKMKALDGKLVVTTACGEKTLERPVCVPVGGPVADTGVDTGADTGADTRSDAEAGITCSAPLSACGTSCVNLSSDPAHCGTCGHACPSGQSCAGSACTATSTPWAGAWSGSFTGTIDTLSLPVSGTATVTLTQKGSTLSGTGSLGIPAYPSCGATTLPCNGSVLSDSAQLTCTNTAGTLTLQPSLSDPQTMRGSYVWQTSASGCYTSRGTFALTLRTSGAETGPQP